MGAVFLCPRGRVQESSANRPDLPMNPQVQEQGASGGFSSTCRLAMKLHFSDHTRERKIEPEGGTEMKRLTLSLPIAAAALTIAAATASAQSLKAEIPFAFQTG